MKTVFSTLVLATSVAAASFSNPTKPAKKSAAAPDLGQQLSACITYPAGLPKLPNGSVVMIQFKVGANNRLRQLAVFTADAKLNDDLVRQLTGQKLTMKSNDPDQVHTMRVHFQTD